jgi:CzcA family heavy metal efflux pump
MWLTRLALRNPVLIAMVTLATILLGMVSLERLPIDLFPNINLPVLRVGTLYPGAGPQDVERSITYPIEKAVSGISDVEHIESASKEGVSLVSVWLNWGANTDVAMVEAANHIQQILNTLPSGVQVPFILKFDLANIPVCTIVVLGDNLGERALYDLASNVIEPQLEQLPGVAGVAVNGGQIRQITALLDRERMAAVGLTIPDVVRTLNGANLIEPAGWIKIGGHQYRVHTNAQLRTIGPANDLVVAARAGVPVRIRDLGRVVDGTEQQTNIVRVNGRRGVYLAVNKQPGSNTVNVVDGVRQALGRLVGLPPGVRLLISFDESKYIREAVAALRSEALQGAVLALVVILVFVQDLRATLIISLAIPLSMLATFLLLYLSGQTLNIFSLGGLALAVGRMVDDSIVELENISRHFAIDGANRRSVLAAAHEVRMPVLASTVTTIIVFLPTLFVTGVGQILFLPTAVAVTCSLTASYFVSTTATPLLCLRLVRPGAAVRRGLTGLAAGLCRRMVAGLEAGYGRLLARALSRRGTLFALVAAAALSAVWLAPSLGVEFFPSTDESQFEILMRAPVGTRVEETEKIVKQVEAEVRRDIPRPWIRELFSNIGLLTTAGRTSARSASYSSNTGPHAAYILVYLVNPRRRSLSSNQLMARLGDDLRGRFPRVQFFMRAGGIVTHVLNFGQEAPIDVELFGYDLDRAARTAKRVARLMRATAGVTDVHISREENFPEIDVNIDRERAALAGTYEYGAAQLILDSATGSTQSPSVFIDPQTGNEYNIVARYQDRYTSHFDDLASTFVVNPLAAGDHLRNQGVVRLESLARITPGSGPLEVDRRYLERVIDITANPTGRDLGSIAASLERKLGRLTLPPGFKVRLAGQIAEQRATFKSLTYVTGLALMLVYMVLAVQFRSLADPVIVIVSVPLGVVGVVWALWATRTPFSTPAFMGVIMMVGIVVSNAVLMVHYTNLLRSQGAALREAVLRAAVVRLRPILMTTVATLAGLLPMAFSWAVGSETDAPLARAVIGGLGVSTLLTLFFVPVLYTTIEEFFHRAPRSG